MTKEEFVAFADNILALEADKAEITAEIKQNKAAFASSHGIEVDSVADSIAIYKKYLKDKQKFVTVDMEISAIINEVIYKELEENSSKD